jgi:hypothetical protein
LTDLLADFKQFVTDAEAGTQFAAWKKANPNDYGRWATFRDLILQGQRPDKPTMKTPHGWELIDAGMLYLDATIPPPPVDPWAVIPPNGPIVVSKDDPGLGENVQTSEQLHDYSIDGTGDSGVLFQQNAAGSSMSRAKMTRICALPGPGWSTHGFYVAVPDVTLSDIDCSVTPGPHVGQVFSVRHGGFQLSRARVDGAPHILGFFEEDTTSGDVFAEYVRGSFTDDCAIWLDSSVSGRNFVFKDWDVTGTGVAVKVGPGFKGNVSLINFKVNGVLVTYTPPPIPLTFVGNAALMFNNNSG